jgi:iron(III) transport system permease protein
MIVSGIILYLVYGVGSRDLGERLEIKDRRRKRMMHLRSRFAGKPRTDP